MSGAPHGVAESGGVDRVVYNACPHDCADKCSILSHVAAGRLVRIEGNPNHPVTRGFLCRKMATAHERVYSPDRIQYPLLRTGPKGSGQFRRIGWDEAIARIVERWNAIVAEDGPQAILPFFGSGTEGLVNGHFSGRRFFNRLGTYQLERTICTRAGRTGYRVTMGTSAGADPTEAGNARLVVLWGVNPATTNIHQFPFFEQARRNGAKFVVVNPVRVRGAETAAMVLQPRPATDAALALGIMNVLIAEGRCDEDFLARCAVGYDGLRRRAALFPPERVAALADIPVDQVLAFARLYAGEPRSFITVGPGCQRHSNGGMTLRTIACLPALTGAWRWPGCGAYFPTSTVFPVDWHALEGDDLRPNPPAGYNMIHLGRLLTEPGPPVRSLFVFMGNPAAVLYDQNRVRAGLLRDDLFTVVHELWMTDTALHADIVLPATSQFEQVDVLNSYFHPSLLFNDRAIAPVGEARSNHEVFRALAAALGFTEPCFAQSEEDVVAEVAAFAHPALAGVGMGKLRRDGWAEVGWEPINRRLADGRTVPVAERIRLYAADEAEAGRDPLPAYLPPRESRDGSPELFARYPLHLLTPAGHSSHNSSYADRPGLTVRDRRPTLMMNPADAGPRGIADGAVVRVFNGRGAFHIWVEVTAEVRPGVVVAPALWWSRCYPGGAGNANFTTPDFVADMGGGSAFNTNLVDVEVAPP